MFSHKYKHHAWVAVGGKGNSLWTTFKRKNKSQEELELDFEFMLFDCADWTLDLLKLIFLAFTYFLLCLNKIFQAVLFFFAHCSQQLFVVFFQGLASWRKTQLELIFYFVWYFCFFWALLLFLGPPVLPPLPPSLCALLLSHPDSFPASVIASVMRALWCGVYLG